MVAKVDKTVKTLWFYIYGLGGSLSLGLAIVGIFTPVLPTTPFLLLAAFCYSKSSKRMHDWLVHRSPFGGYIRDWQSTRSISLRTKVTALLLLAVTIGSSILWFIPITWAKWVAAISGVCVAFYLLRIPTRNATEGTSS